MHKIFKFIIFSYFKTAPWLKIMKSKTCLSLFVGHCCQNFGTYMFLTQLPTYMKEILKFDIKSVRNYFNIFYFGHSNMQNVNVQCSID